MDLVYNEEFYKLKLHHYPLLHLNQLPKKEEE